MAVPLPGSRADRLATAAGARVLLVTPPYHAGVVEAAGVWMPLGLVYLAGHARRAGAEPRIYDAMSLRHTHADIAREIQGARPDVVAVTTITATEPDAREICRTAKAIDPRIVTVVGGVHATFMWRELLAQEPAIDLVVRGEGEATFEHALRALQAGSGLDEVPGLALRRDGAAFATAPRPFAADLDSLTPAWDLLDWPLYHYRPAPEGRLAIVSSSRGCRQACTFCSQQLLWKRTWRARSPEAFVAELELLRDRHGVRVAMLADETPTVDPARWRRLLDLLVERAVGVELLMETRVDDVIRDADILPRYREAGVSHVYLGVESASQETLDLYRKNTRAEQGRRAIQLINQAGMVSETSFVLGTPEETRESIHRAVELAKWYGPDMAFFLALTPWPYADIRAGLEPHIAVHDYRKYNLVEPVLKPEAMTLDEVRAALLKATGDFFHDKLSRLEELPEKKRVFMARVMKLLIQHSYLGAEMHAMAGKAHMPARIRAIIDDLGVSWARQSDMANTSGDTTRDVSGRPSGRMA